MGNNGRFSDGFLMGAVVGGALVFLLGTEKGNRVLKLMMEEGRAGLNDLMDEIEEYKEQAKEVVEIATEDDIDDDLEVTKESSEVKEENNSTSENHKSSSRKFFRKAK